jgi:uncharacterized repeat protein (TIGR01451 family)
MDERGVLPAGRTRLVTAALVAVVAIGGGLAIAPRASANAPVGGSFAWPPVASASASAATAEQTLLVSQAPSGALSDRAGSGAPTISADGRYVAFESRSTNLGPDANTTADVFVRDMSSDTVTLVSVPTGPVPEAGGMFADQASRAPAISADGRYVAFESDATNLGPDANATTDVFVRDLLTETTTLASVATGAVPGAGGTFSDSLSTAPAISADGRYVAFESYATNLGPDANGLSDVFVRDRQTNTTTLASVPNGAVPVAGGGFTNDGSHAPTISGDGHRVTFSTAATNVGPDHNAIGDLFVRDLPAHTTTLASVPDGAVPTTPGGAFTDGVSDGSPSISADGRFVAFTSRATNLGPDHNTRSDVFVRDLQAETTRLVSVPDGPVPAPGGAFADGEGADPVTYTALSADGRFVAFVSYSHNLTTDAVVGGGSNVFVRDTAHDTTTAASVAGEHPFTGVAISEQVGYRPAISADGRDVAFLELTETADPHVSGNTDQVHLRRFGAGGVEFAADDFSVNEGAGSATVTVKRVGGSYGSATVDYATTASGTATAGVDYTPASGTLTFAPGVRSRTFTVPVTQDAVDEDTESVGLALSNPGAGAGLGTRSSATLNILDDDGSPEAADVRLIASTASGVVVPGGRVTVTISLENRGPDKAFGVVVDYELSEGLVFVSATPTQGACTQTSCRIGELPLHGLAQVAVVADVAPGVEGTDVFMTATATAVSVDQDITNNAARANITVLRPLPPEVAPPSTAVEFDPATPEPGGYFANSVRVRVSAFDANYPADKLETRCVLDPPAAPERFDDMPPSCAFKDFATITSLGDHVLYASTRNDGGSSNRPPVTRIFKVRATPETTISGGPQGPTWQRAPEFTFTATVAGASFECRIDGRAWGACASPYRANPLASGDHSIDVRATSPDGSVDPTPAHRAFHVNEPAARLLSCEVKPVRAWGALLHTQYAHESGVCLIGRSPGGCPAGERCATSDGCPDGTICRWTDATCPRDASCTLTTGVQWFDADHNVWWSAEAYATVGDYWRDYPYRLAGSCFDDYRLCPPNAGALCDTGYDGDRCNAQARLTVIGDDRPILAVCWVTFPLTHPAWANLPQPELGSDFIRRIECSVELKIEPAVPLSAAASGTSASVYAPAAGTVAVDGSGSTGARTAAARRGSLRITPARKTATRSGPVAFKLKLNAAAKRVLRRRGKLRLALRVRFTPRAGAPLTRTQKITLTRAHKPTRRSAAATPRGHRAPAR